MESAYNNKQVADNQQVIILPSHLHYYIHNLGFPLANNQQLYTAIILRSVPHYFYPYGRSGRLRSSLSMHPSLSLPM